MNQLLIDSSYLYALLSTDDVRHQTALTLAERSTALFLVPDIVLPEVTFLFDRAGGIPARIKFLNALMVFKPDLVPLTFPDIQRAIEIASQYHEASLDFVDCCIMATSERMNITRVCTFDRRDFSIFRPLHCDYLELLP